MNLLGVDKTIEITLTEAEARSLQLVLQMYHDIDTTMKVQISDTDETHYFIEDLADRLAELIRKHFG